MLEGRKPAYNRFLLPLARPLLTMGLHPNHVTLIGLCFFCVAGWLSYSGIWIAAAAALIIGSFCDGLDGLLARLGGRQTAFGALFDSTCDRLTEIVLLFGLLGFYHSHAATSLHAPGILLCYTAITLSLMVSYVKARCEGAGIACTGGLLQRPERLILLGLGLLAGPAAMVWILGLLSALAGFTMVQRLAAARKAAHNPS
jgi:CDP-diacylglycerol--glycerol-3-phosphate 3-phosphatidyltransferase